MFYTIFVTSLLIIPFWECNVTGTPSANTCSGARHQVIIRPAKKMSVIVDKV
jgi:hypothetical protein